MPNHLFENEASNLKGVTPMLTTTLAHLQYQFF